jgi:hypothetical protein
MKFCLWQNFWLKEKSPSALFFITSVAWSFASQNSRAKKTLGFFGDIS